MELNLCTAGKITLKKKRKKSTVTSLQNPCPYILDNPLNCELFSLGILSTEKGPYKKFGHLALKILLQTVNQSNCNLLYFFYLFVYLLDDSPEQMYQSGLVVACTCCTSMTSL